MTFFVIMAVIGVLLLVADASNGLAYDFSLLGAAGIAYFEAFGGA